MIQAHLTASVMKQKMAAQRTNLCQENGCDSHWKKAIGKIRCPMSWGIHRTMDIEVSMAKDRCEIIVVVGSLSREWTRKSDPPRQMCVHNLER